ncbi:MAG: hypothetical protein RIQ89_2383 [Bacteroidota bacterium]|jgi:8-oxo-dGTP pyrophosphatase MutT (NUDIX family)
MSAFENKIIIQQLEAAFKGSLPGKTAHQKLAHPDRMAMLELQQIQNARRGAVMIALSENKSGAILFPLIQRSNYDGVHSGQIALPGGKFEKQDLKLSNTAIRETKEELGITIYENQIVGELSNLYIPPSNFLVNPFVSYSATSHLHIKDEREVADVIEVNLDHLINEWHAKVRTTSLSNGKQVNLPSYEYKGHIIWGATAMILTEFKMLLTKKPS